MNQISIQSKRFALLVVAAIVLAACGGSSENSSSASSAVTRTKNNALPTEATTTTVESCATGGACAVGDTGPGGGKVFYVATSKFTSTGSACGTACMYLEAAPIGWVKSGGQSGCSEKYQGSSTVDPACFWDTCLNCLVGTTGTGIGKGYANTKAITGFSGAADMARNFKGGGKTDWFLPSKDELNQMYLNKTTIGGLDLSEQLGPVVLNPNYYWSSSEDGKGTAWSNWFFNGSQTIANKQSQYFVRPVRAFSGTTAQGLAAVVTTTTSTTVAPTTTSTTIAPGSVVASCARGGACAVGDVGPGGGKVFYVSASGFTSDGSACGTQCKYLEAAPTGWITAATPAGQKNCTTLGTSTLDPKCEWSGNTSTAIATTDTRIGKGYANTSKMISQSGTAGKAGTVARAFQGGGKTDWYLPSKDELNQIYLNKGIIGIDRGAYWSSSEYEVQAFENGLQRLRSKEGDGIYVRPVRAFKQTKCAEGGACAVGDTGPGGGKVFYVSASGFTSTGSACGTKCMYLEAAPTGWITAATPAGQKNCTTLGTSTLDPKCEWSGNASVAIVPVGKLIGTGYANTSAMITQSGTTGKAGTVARAFQGGGKTDWYLPSRDELYEMSLNMGIIGIDSGKYWSSTQAENSASASLRSFNLGYELDGFKTTANYVRPVRAF